MDEPADMLLSYAISEIAARFGSVCDEVIVGEMPDAEFPGVTFTIPQRGDRAKLLEVSRRNAEQSRADALKQAEKLDPDLTTVHHYKLRQILRILLHHPRVASGQHLLH